jgi:cytochrome b561
MNASIILGLLITVLLRKTLFNWRINSVVIEEKMKAAGTVITHELAKDIAVAIRNPLWDFHIYLGFALSVFFIGRICIAIFKEKKCPGYHALKSALGIKNLPDQKKSNAIHYSLVKAGHAAFYLSTFVMVATGFLLNFKADLGLEKSYIAAAKEIHELLMWFFVVFIAGHVLGLIISENSKEPGIVSDMIHGGDPKLK